MAGSKEYKYSIGVYSFYFGAFPEWIDLYFASLDRNSSIDFHVFTDCSYAKPIPSNVYIHEVEFGSYLEYIRSRLNVVVNADSPIKLCDIRPMIGMIHKDVFEKYDFYGWIDLDLLMGDVRTFYTEEILKNYDVFSTHSVRIAGHFSLFRNNRKNRNKYKSIYNWKQSLANPRFVGLDEHGITNAYTMTFFDKFNEKFHSNINNVFTRYFSKLKKRKLYMVEQYTTPFTPIPWTDGSLNNEQPDVWFYKDGIITNNRDSNRQFIYIHFMNFKTSTWRVDGQAPWQGKNNICNAVVDDMKTGIVIDCDGIHKLL